MNKPRRAVITGGSSPLGAAITRRLAREGHEVIIHTHTAISRAAALAAEIKAAGGHAQVLACDLTDIPGTALAIEGFLVNSPPIQILVHNAGTHDDVPLAGMSESQWRNVVDVSLHGFFSILRPLILPMIGTRWGRVVAISSISGVMGNRGQVNYAAAKAGLIGAIKSLSLEYASRGVTANAVAPGIIASPAVDAVLTREKIAEIVPARRAGKPEEVADLVGFLASEQAGYITGQTISITGGLG